MRIALKRARALILRKPSARADPTPALPVSASLRFVNVVVPPCLEVIVDPDQGLWASQPYRGTRL